MIWRPISWTSKSGTRSFLFDLQCVCVCVCVWGGGYVWVCVYAHANMYVCVYVCARTCMFVLRIILQFINTLIVDYKKIFLCVVLMQTDICGGEPAVWGTAAARGAWHGGATRAAGQCCGILPPSQGQGLQRQGLRFDHDGLALGQTQN